VRRGAASAVIAGGAMGGPGAVRAAGARPAIARPRRIGAGLLLAGAMLLGGCQSLYFGPAGEAPQPPPMHRLEAWPDRDYWSGIVFNGEKIGFSHLSIVPAATPGEFELHSDAAFVLRFMGYDKRVNLKAFDVVRDDLDLVRFEYAYSIDGSELALAGARRGDALEVTVTRGGETTRQTLAAPGRVYPQAAIALYPTRHGLAPGRVYRYPVYSGELQKLAEVTQRIVGHERSKLFDGLAFHVETSMEGYDVETWIDARGRPLLEIALNGVLVTGLEDEARARRYLTAAAVNKDEALLDFARVRVTPPLHDPRAVTAMTIALRGAARDVPSGGMQRCAREAAATVCTVRTAPAALPPAADATDPRYLASTFTVPARNALIGLTAREIAGTAREPAVQVRRIVDWIAANIRTTPADAWSALDVLERRAGECQGHAYLYAAFARALGIPTRVANGIVYSEDFGGFLYHSWAESLVDGRWLAVDPTFGMVPADATHVKLVEGETLAELAPLVDWVGRLRLRVLAVEPAR